ncbi:MAG TPA: wax ester/triacylglycerol synthase family O-acyltransferase [Candidatus Polarisedimenticolaceae bacterium]|nr:wax ester/triacylglycerol synthase family O-acyltransferase [Candidatus Polarisedimenticolaceae bacterium]
MRSTGASSRHGRSFTGSDSFWLRMDAPTNLMMISAVLLFEQPLDHARLRRVVRERLLPVDRFRDRVVRAADGTARWERHPALDLDQHLVVLRLPEPADEAALCAAVGRLMSEPLDPSRPLWQFHLIERYGTGSALIGRFHHCLGDGLGMMIALLAMSDLDPDGGATTGDRANPFLALLRNPGEGTDRVRRGLEQIMPEGTRLLLRPGEALRRLGPLKRTTAASLALARLVFRRPDRRTLFNAELGVAKRAAWSRRIPVERVKGVRDAIGGTVNDILLTAMAGGIRRYVVARDGEAGCMDFRATVPVNLRPIEQLAAMGNEFGLVYLRLPIAIADPIERLAELRRRMEPLKRSAEALVVLRLIATIGRLPEFAQRQAVRLFASKATSVMTNVPGPIRTLYLAGRPVADLIFWVPRSGGLSLGVSIMSYAGNVRLGVATDAGLVPDPERIVEGFDAEFAAMMQLRCSPDGRPR